MRKELQILLAVGCSMACAAGPAICFAVQETAPQQSAPIEQGKFRLHKFEQPIGEENYQITRRDGDSRVC